MKFSELEGLMFDKGISSLADIARSLDTTPQAVSNWKSRDQVPHHVVAKISKSTNQYAGESSKRLISSNSIGPHVSLSDVLLVIAEQLKIIVLTTFIFSFMTFTYVKFIKQPSYTSVATVLLPQNNSSGGGMDGLSGLASQFGVNLPVAAKQLDLSSPSLIPELLSSRTFAEKIIEKEFYTEKFGKKVSLLSIITGDNNIPSSNREELVNIALSSLNSILEFDENSIGGVSSLKVTVNEPTFAKNLADIVLKELEALHQYYKNIHTTEKTMFIEKRILSVSKDLESSEVDLKKFNEQNRQISSPSLQLEFDRYSREVEIQKGIFLTLKQQLELAKIEEVQKSSVIQILDMPVVPMYPSNINLTSNLLLSIVLGLLIGIILGFLKSYLNNNDMEERKKLRRVRNFLKKKSKDVVLDYRFTGIISLLLLICLPLYLGAESKNPKYFNMYSSKYLVLNIAYLITFVSSSILFIKYYRKEKNNK